MKTILSTFALVSLLAGSAHADLRTTMENFKKQVLAAHNRLPSNPPANGQPGSSQPGQPVPPNGTEPSPEPSPMPEPMPIRQGNARIKISKITSSTQSDGTISVTMETLCSVKGTFNVFDMRQQPAGLQWGPNSISHVAACDGKIGGKTVTVHVDGIMSLFNTTFFDTSEDAKLASAVLYTDDGTTSPQPPSSSVGASNIIITSAGTTDLNNHSLLMNLFPIISSSSSCSSSTDGNTQCTPPTPVVTETFAADIDMQDQ